MNTVSDGTQVENRIVQNIFMYIETLQVLFVGQAGDQYLLCISEDDNGRYFEFYFQKSPRDESTEYYVPEEVVKTGMEKLLKFAEARVRSFDFQLCCCWLFF